MKPDHSPLVDRAYWGAILLASVAGTNLGDLYAHDSGLGIARGLALLAFVAGLAFLAERRDRRVHEGWFWLVILLIRTGATNIADFMAWRLHSPLPLLLGGLVALMAIMAALTRWVPGPRANRGDANRLATRLSTGPAFWLAMLAAGVFGTVAGDVLSGIVGQGGASLALIGPLLVLMALQLRAGPGGARSLALYWLAVALARTTGTAIGDFLAESPMLGLGLPWASALTTAAFVAVVRYGQGLRAEP